MSYTLDRAHIVPFANQIQHFRQRSSVSRIVGLEPTAQTRRSYEGRLSLDHLPPSPPLMAWDPDSPGSNSPPPPKRPALPQKKSTDGLLSTKLAERAPLVWRTPSRGGSRKGKSGLSLPALAALATGGFLLVLYTILSADSSSDGFGLVPQLRSSLRNGPCDPYAAPGQLQVDVSDPDLNQWHPNDVSCQAPRFFQQLRSSNDRYQRGSIPHSDFGWVRGKTVLLIGDSVSREHVENFCQLMGEDAEVIRPTHKWAPAPAPLRGATRANPGGAAHSRRHAQQRSGPAAFRDAGRPRMCYIPRFDLLLVSVLHYGLDQQDYWELSRHPLYTAPGAFEHRISDVVRPLLANIRADGRPSAPDYIEFAPGTWDLARFAEEDAMLQRDTQTPLTPDRVAWFRHRVESASERIRAAFPSARAKFLRTMYYPLDQRSEVDYFMDKTATTKSNGTSVAYFAHERVNQLNEAMRSLSNEHPSYPASGKQYEAPGLGFSVKEFGRILKGHQPHQTDRLHGEPVPGGYVWADIMLYNLWKASRQ